MDRVLGTEYGFFVPGLGGDAVGGDEALGKTAVMEKLSQAFESIE